MNKLFELKDRMQDIYARYTVFVDKGMQFILALLVFHNISSQIGFFKPVASPVITIAMTLLCTILPIGATAVLSACLVMAHLFGLSIPALAIGAGLFLLVYIFCLRFTPEYSWVLLIVILLLQWHMWAVIPVALGLLGGASVAATALGGVVIYYFLAVIKQSFAVLKTGENAGIIADMAGLLKRYAANKEMWVMAFLVVAGILVVYLIRSRGIAHGWKVASAAGAIVSILVSVVGNIALGTHISYGFIFLSAVLAIAVGLLLELLFFSVDYKGVQSVQFEDDEFVYFVKAVPKVGVSAVRKKIRKISESPEADEEEAKEPSPTAEKVGGPVSEANDTVSSSSPEEPIPNEEDIVAITRRTEDELALTKSLSRHMELDEGERK